MNAVEAAVAALASRISGLPEVSSVGLASHPLPERPEEGDIDLFVYCSAVPEPGVRSPGNGGAIPGLENVQLRAFVSPLWGDADYMEIRGIETWVMYFTLAGAERNFQEILDGQYPGRLDSYYYPVGRLAMFGAMSILSDKAGFLADLKARLEPYPEKLRRAVIGFHLPLLDDREDLLRAVGRKDVLFYHFALDLALDHLLQLLFALNSTYFPSRKRSSVHLDRFLLVPRDTAGRLREIIALGAGEETISRSYDLFDRLAVEVRELATR